eukprot:2975359-Prymnesium_polylepis.1
MSAVPPPTRQQHRASCCATHPGRERERRVPEADALRGGGSRAEDSLPWRRRWRRRVGRGGEEAAASFRRVTRHPVYYRFTPV